MEAKKKKATNDDEVPNEAYQDSEVAREELYQLVKQMWQKGEVPRELVTTVFVMIYKKGDKNDKWNYRPIGLLSHAYKILSKLILLKIQPIIEKMLPDNQCGFRAKRSTVDSMTPINELFKRVLEEGRKVLAIFVDFKDAFSTMSHKFMKRMLKQIGVSKKVRQLFKSIYSQACGKIRQINADGTFTYSKLFEINRGVIQGDIFSPLVFTAGLAVICDKALIKEFKAKFSKSETCNLEIGEEFYADDACLCTELDHNSDTEMSPEEERNELIKIGQKKLNRFTEKC